MPSLSFVLSALIVGAGSIYLYLSQTDKIEDAKKKIQETKKIEYINKKTSLTLSTVKNTDSNNSLDIIASSGDKLSNFVALTKDVEEKDLILIDRCQKEVQKQIEQGNTPNIKTLKACKKLSEKKFNFYGLSAGGVSIPEKSILRNSTNTKTLLPTQIALNSLNEQIINKKIKKLVIKKKLEERIKNNDLSKKFKDKFIQKEIAYLERKLAFYQKEKKSVLAYKKALLTNINSLRGEISSLQKNLNNLIEQKNRYSSNQKEQTNHTFTPTRVVSKITHTFSSFFKKDDKKEDKEKSTKSNFNFSNNNSMLNNITKNISSTQSSLTQKRALLRQKEQGLQLMEQREKNIDDKIKAVQEKINKLKGNKNA